MTEEEMKAERDKIIHEAIGSAYDKGFENGWRECNQSYEEMIGRITAGKPKQ